MEARAVSVYEDMLISNLLYAHFFVSVLREKGGCGMRVCKSVCKDMLISHLLYAHFFVNK